MDTSSEMRVGLLDSLLECDLLAWSDSSGVQLGSLAKLIMTNGFECSQ